MPVNRLYAMGLAAWSVSVVAILALREFFSAFTLSRPETAGWLVLAAVPPIVSLIVFRQASPSVAQVLHEAEPPRVPAAPRNGNDVRRS